MKATWILVGDRTNDRGSYGFAPGAPEPDTATIGTMLSMAVSAGSSVIRLAGGEPTLRRDLPRVIGAARALGLDVELLTNARIFSYAGAAPAFTNAGLGMARVTLLGPDRAIHDELAGDGSFDQAIGGIRNLVAAGVTVGVDVPVHMGNIDVLDRMESVLDGTGVSFVCFRPAPSFEDEWPDDLPTMSAVAAAVSRAVRKLDSGSSGPRAFYAAMPCCLLPDLKGRELPGPGAEGLIRLGDVSNAGTQAGQPVGRDRDGATRAIVFDDGGRPARSLPFPCVACELRGACSTVPEEYVRARGTGELHLPMQSVSAVRFDRVAVASNPVSPDGTCHYSQGDAPAGIDQLFLVQDGVTTLWRKISGHSDASTLMHSKNIRNNLVIRSSGLIPRLDPACRGCENLSRCAAVFHVPEGGDRYSPTAPAISSKACGREDFLTWPDFASGFADFVARSAGGEIRFEGDAPVIFLDGPNDGPVEGHESFVEPMLLWEAARKAAMTELVDYDLPYAGPRFGLTLRSSDRWAQVDRMGTILIIRKCTMNCIICQVQKFYEGIDLMPLPDVVRFLEEFRLLGFTRLDLFGGEPTMRRDLVDLVRFAHRLGFYTDLITNGTLMDDALATALRDAGLDLCIVSLDGPTPEIHDRIRRVKDGHTRAIAGMEAAVRAGGMEVNVDTVVLPDNIDHLIDLALQVSELGVTRINMFLCLEGPISSPVPRLLGFDRTVDLYERIIPEMRRIGAQHGTSISVGPRLLTAGRPLKEVFCSRMFKNITEGTYNVIHENPEILCKAPDDEVYISLFGDVYPCTAPQMLESSARMGNVYRDKLITVLRSERWSEFKKISGHHEGCRMCWRAHFDLDQEGEERVLDL